MHVGLLRYTFKLARGQAPKFGEIFAGGPILRVIGVALLITPPIVLGWFLVIVPGVMLSLGWFFATYLAIDRRMGVVDSIKAS
jgi:uncharacterized membrane protein